MPCTSSFHCKSNFILSIMIKSKKSKDFDLAYKLHQEINSFGITENATLTKHKEKENYKPRTLIDQTLELIDPTPNIHTLFIQFNARFFWNALLPVEVKWSNRMTSCAGICTFHPRNRQCVIALSAPLLKLRPRKDLVETLLHEMIHGYLFLTNNNRDRDGHGPEFCKHMNRINMAAGTSITIYHSFHNEVKLYQQHWWRCDGPCQGRAPYFGTVRRAMNRAPGPTDFWWKEHKQNCGGTFIKIKEPENFKAKNTKSKEKAKPTSKVDNFEKNISNWLTKNSKSITAAPSTSTPTRAKVMQNDQNELSRFKKLGNGTNNVFGWGIGGPNGSNNSKMPGTLVSSTPRFSSTKALGGSSSGRSNLLNKFDSSNNQKKSPKQLSSPTSKSMITSWINGKKIPNVINKEQTLKKRDIKLVECPICNNFVSADIVNTHIDSCLLSPTGSKPTKPGESLLDEGIKLGVDNYENSSSKSSIAASNSTFLQKRKTDSDNTFSSKHKKLSNSENLGKGNCPICNKQVKIADINEHVDRCLSGSTEQDNNKTVELIDSNTDTWRNDSIISISSTSSSDLSPSIGQTTKDLCPVSDPSISKVNAASHKCLVCDMLITAEMSLNDHLEDCVGSVFNDDSTMQSDCDDESESQILIEEDTQYPCPVCMELISESVMNQHLDTCLDNT